MDAALGAGDVAGALGLGDGAVDRVADEFLMPVATGLAVIDLPDDLAIRVMESAFTAEKVPTPPAAAQVPQVSPFDTATPLPPSTSGRTSTPPMRIALMAFK